jgi:hypothetical protein
MAVTVILLILRNQSTRGGMDPDDTVPTHISIKMPHFLKVDSGVQTYRFDCINSIILSVLNFTVTCIFELKADRF